MEKEMAISSGKLGMAGCDMDYPLLGAYPENTIVHFIDTCKYFSGFEAQEEKPLTVFLLGFFVLKPSTKE